VQSRLKGAKEEGIQTGRKEGNLKKSVYKNGEIIDFAEHIKEKEA